MRQMVTVPLTPGTQNTENSEKLKFFVFRLINIAKWGVASTVHGFSKFSLYFIFHLKHMPENESWTCGRSSRADGSPEQDRERPSREARLSTSICSLWQPHWDGKGANPEGPQNSQRRSNRFSEILCQLSWTYRKANKEVQLTDLVLSHTWVTNKDPSS